MIKVDVSEIKTFKACTRKWQLSSRNGFHLRPKVSPANFVLGTIFHEALAQLYLGVDYDKVMAMVRREMQTDSDAALLAMIPGYYKNVLPDDLDRFKVLDIEHHFEIPFEECLSSWDVDDDRALQPDLVLCGSIDMIVLDVAQNKIYGFEHKTCKSFREETFLWMDEQPRVYTYALQFYIKEYNRKKYEEWLELCASIDAAGGTLPDKPEPVTLGGIYINEVKKLLRNFQYKRTLCTYTKEDLYNFMQTFYKTCTQCQHSVENNSYAAPQPSYFNCNMCEFNTICATYMYNNLDKKVILNEFEEEFVERTEDHLDEKVERSVSDDK